MESLRVQVKVQVSSLDWQLVLPLECPLALLTARGRWV